MPTHSRLTRRAGAAVVCLALGLASCGDDGDGEAGSQDDAPTTTTATETNDTTTTPTTTEPPASTEPPVSTEAPPTTAAPETTAGPPTTGDVEQAALDEPAVCTPYLAVSAAMTGEPDPATVAPLLDDVDATAPDDIADQLSVMTGGARAVLETGDFSALETPEFDAATRAAEGWVLENCAFTTMTEITAAEYAYTGLSDTYPAGRAAFRLVNSGAQAHEIIIVRKNDGVELSFEELLELPDSEAESVTTFVGATFVPSTGDVGTLVADLEPGDYLAVCFVPDGTVVAPDGSFTEGTGDPHVMLGMSFEFSVT